MIRYVHTSDFLLEGDFKMAYEYLKDLFESKRDSKSGPIRPYTQQELDEQANRSTKDFLIDLPPTISS